LGKQLKELVEYLASALVDDPSCVKVSERGTPENLALSLTVRREDLGKVIGKKGRTAKAMRALLSSISMQQNRRVSLEILEPHLDAPPPAEISP